MVDKLKTKLYFLILFLICAVNVGIVYADNRTVLSGRVLNSEKEAVDYATVYLKGTTYGCTSDSEGLYHMSVPAGDYVLVVSAVGYDTFEKEISLPVGVRTKHSVVLKSSNIILDEVTVVSNGVSRLKRSAFNAVAIDAGALQNSTQNLGEALAQAPGMKLRESGGVGSDMQLMMDGFSGKHIKIFIDGVPQEGVGSSFSINNIPVNYAERIEVYKGVVPVGFGTDALGGVINIVTRKNERKWFIDASYSYGSFNTHKSYVNFGQTLKNGFTYEINAFQNFSDNSYYIDTPVKNFETGAINKKNIEHVRRFHDNYHNEAIVGKMGVTNKPWADRLMFGLTYSHFYKEIQNGVIQEIVFGGKYRKGYSLMPSFEYRKNNLIVKGLDVVLTANYNRNMTNNVDTATWEYNWRGEKRQRKSPGEQSYQDTRSDNYNWNGTLTVSYRLNSIHQFTFNHVLSSSLRNNTSLLGSGDDAVANAIPKSSIKNISGLSYRIMPGERWNLSAFGKYYNQLNSGPVATTVNAEDYNKVNNRVSAFGYGAAGTYFILSSLQAKLSYEKAYRLPTNEEMFGDEDMEQGKVTLQPENSHNINFSMSYNRRFGKHSVYAEGGIVYRNTRDYIQRKIVSLSGGLSGATYENHGKVLTKGYNLSVRYGFGGWISVGGNFTQMDVRDNVKTIGSETLQENPTYGARMPNLPYRFANSDISFHWRNLFGKGNVLTVTYDNLYMHGFPLYSEKLGDSSNNDFIVPTQFSHNLSLSYSISEGKYNLSFECRNFTNEKLYDNFSLQKAGRAFYGKVRICFNGK